MSCRFARDDAVYVLGALPPAERLDFERHLAGCRECNDAVREVAGLPGLLGRVDGGLLEPPTVDETLPETLLPALSGAVRRTRRRRTLATSGAAAAAAAVIATGTVVTATQLGDADRRATAPEAPRASASPADAAAQDMVAVGDVPVQAQVVLESVTWGTRLDLTCTYDPASVDYELPPEADYTLFVRTRDGRTERVGSWRSTSGGAMRITAATAVARADLASVEVRTPRGDTVLQLAP